MLSPTTAFSRHRRIPSRLGDLWSMLSLSQTGSACPSSWVRLDVPLFNVHFRSFLLTQSYLLAKVSTSSSANIFTNRELEVLSRALALRRLTYTLFCSPKDTFLAQLPAVQEKLVDLLRSPVGDLVHAEVRFILCERRKQSRCEQRLINSHRAGLLVSSSSLLPDRQPTSRWPLACPADRTSTYGLWIDGRRRT